MLVSLFLVDDQCKAQRSWVKRHTSGSRDSPLGATAEWKSGTRSEPARSRDKDRGARSSGAGNPQLLMHQLAVYRKNRCLSRVHTIYNTHTALRDKDSILTVDSKLKIKVSLFSKECQKTFRPELNHKFLFISVLPTVYPPLSSAPSPYLSFPPSPSFPSPSVLPLSPASINLFLCVYIAWHMCFP